MTGKGGGQAMDRLPGQQGLLPLDRAGIRPELPSFFSRLGQHILIPAAGFQENKGFEKKTGPLF
jgi:hypothetical protein